MDEDVREKEEEESLGSSPQRRRGLHQTGRVGKAGSAAAAAGDRGSYGVTVPT